MREGSSSGVAGGDSRFVAEAPHPLEVVEAAHFRPEQVDDHIAGVDQHPVGGRQALYARASLAGGLEPFGELSGDRGDLPGPEYWRRVIDTAAFAHGELDSALDALQAADARSWTDYRQEMWDVASEFKTARGRTALLSNGVPEVMTKLRAERTLADYFDVHLDHAPREGATVPLDTIVLVARSISGGRVNVVGLRLPEDEDEPAPKLTRLATLKRKMSDVWSSLAGI